jgi:hypothetical protein
MLPDSLSEKPKLPPLQHTLLGAAAHLVPPQPGMVAGALKTAPRRRRPSGDRRAVFFARRRAHGAAAALPCGLRLQGGGLGSRDQSRPYHSGARRNREAPRRGPSPPWPQGHADRPQPRRRDSARTREAASRASSAIARAGESHPPPDRDPVAAGLQAPRALAQHRCHGRGGAAQHAARRAGDGNLYEKRRHRRLAKLPRSRRRAPREHRDPRRARHDGAQSRRLAHHRRAVGAGGRGVADLQRASASPVIAAKAGLQDHKRPADPEFPLSRE